MALTLRNDAKTQIIRILRKQGYPTYADLVNFFDIYLTDDPNVVGYMIPGQAKIVLNGLLNIKQVSTVVRHEVLHEYLTHGPRQQKFDKKHPELNPHLAPHDLSNIAADYEISNKGYTKQDKNTMRRLTLGDKVLRALVTEDDYPDWQDLTYEEMYKKLLEQDKEDREQIQSIIDRIQELSKQDIDDMIQDAQNIADDASKDGDEDVQKAAEEAKDAAEQVKQDAEQAESNSSKDDSVFDTPEQQKQKADVAARAAQIKDFIDNLDNYNRIESENRSAIGKERAAKEASDVSNYYSKPLNQFKLNLNRFIADQVGEFEDDSYARIHPSYEDSEFILPGKIVREEKNIPLINVYLDVSGSFSDPKKTEAAFNAIETLNQYVRDGSIEIKLYYFADRVSDKKSNAGGGTRGTPILDHIEQTKPTNVIVITDGDITDCSRVVKVPGAVWMLFYDSRSENLMNHLKGKRQNKYYDVHYS